MRLWPQLQADALATGLFEDYVGDGASVPWLELSPVLGVVPYLYKRYLDARWPEAFQLHDWLYTPYGALIQATQEEADIALRDMIALDSPFDAAIVYAAVSKFGHNWFGISTTGVGVRNRQVTPQKGVSSMAIKVVTLFKNSVGDDGSSQVRVAGFSESFWYPSDNVDALLAVLGVTGGVVGSYLGARAALLPTQASIIGVKLYQGGAGRGRSFGVNYPGSSGLITDVPNIALLMSAVSGVTGATRRWWLHSIPDSMVEKGSFKPSFAFISALGTYIQRLTSFTFLTNPANPVKTDIATVVQVPPVAPATIPTGLATVVSSAGFATGNKVFISRTFNPTNNTTFSDTFTIMDVPGANQVVLSNWQLGNTMDGTMQLVDKVSSPFTSAGVQVVRVGTRKVGSPSDRFRGRRSRRRVKQ